MRARGSVTSDPTRTHHRPRNAGAGVHGEDLQKRSTTASAPLGAEPSSLREADDDFGIGVSRIDLLVELVNDLRSKEAKQSATPITSPHFAFTDCSEG